MHFVMSPKMTDKNKKTLLSNLNDVITCPLCKGYFIDATILVDCLHAFCRGCILRHFEYKTDCPTCKTAYKKKSCFRADMQLQALVYKMVPGLYSKEMQRREDFYSGTGVRASSSCSDDSVIERERDLINDQEESVAMPKGEKPAQFLSPEDLISLSLEYYQVHLDQSAKKLLKTTKIENNNSENKNDNSEDIETSVPHKNNGSSKVVRETSEICDIDKRFLQCPAAVSMKHLQKFLRMKFGLTVDHKVDIIYKGEVLPPNFSLMDVAYTFKWKRAKPMRFFYRIFTPMKIRPIKIVNTTLSTGGKQLQIVAVKPNAEKSEPLSVDFHESEDQKSHKERLFALLNLQSKSKSIAAQSDNKKVPEKTVEDCVFDYVEPDKEEIKRFAEKRDREWALQQKLDHSDYSSHHFTKKRKKSKHSKSDFVHKKRKLHAEITSNEEEDLKLKVKLTPHNGHKHKHHKDLSSKEKLLEMRQIRHKHSSSTEEKSPPPLVPKVPIIKIPKEAIGQISNEIKVILPKTSTVATKSASVSTSAPKVLPSVSSSAPKVVSSVSTSAPKPLVSTSAPPKPSGSAAGSSKSVSFVEPVKTSAKTNVEWAKKVAASKKSEQLKERQKTFLKTFPVGADKCGKSGEKIAPTSIEKAKLAPKLTPTNNNINTNNKFLDRKIANLQQRCTVEAKTPPPAPEANKSEKKVSFNLVEKPTILTSPGFTVSKIETGVKRKSEETSHKIQDKRPSLEITLINPQPAATNNSAKVESKPKRPPPATIPLERIKKSGALKAAGVSIIPKLSSEKCDNIGALDLSNKSPEASPKAEGTLNGFANRQQINVNNLAQKLIDKVTTTATEKNNMQLSNLQMLSKVATEHSSLNKTPVSKPNRPQMPSLQTIKIPILQNGSLKSNLQKLPKLNEIQKFRPMNAQIRHLRPNQNQNIRNIPNPSLLNQNRLNSATPIRSLVDVTKSVTISNSVAQTKANIVTTSSASPIAKVAMIETKIAEKKEISV